MIRTKILGLATVLTLFSMATPLFASPPRISITEVEYKPGSGPGEFMEYTNVTSSAIDVNNWSQDDSNGRPGDHPFGAFFNSAAGGSNSIIQPGESFILTEADPTVFRSYWGLASTVKVYDYGSQDNLSGGEGFFLFCSAHFISENIDPLVFMALVTRAGGEIIPANTF